MLTRIQAAEPAMPRNAVKVFASIPALPIIPTTPIPVSTNNENEPSGPNEQTSLPSSE